ncbi:TPA: tail fiber assembly protein [Escherichia coli]|uniref:tail fiber assembly protein n=1 Tax=Escherichia coli TaxID=562 RepID=UPI001BFDFB57|nr:tail fiber assembly protein [Escherichia coli]HCB7517369.1 tail fiber assembly protein [Escherichia coli]
MINIKNFRKYTPENPPVEWALYLISEDGQDWYECQEQFAENTYKIMYDGDNIVRSIVTDISTLCPVNASVAEVGVLPDDVDIDGNWMFKDGAVIKREYTHEELVQQAKNKKSLLMQQADDCMAPLQDAVDLDMATEEEKGQLLAWKKYRVLLNRVDTSTAPDIEWPAPPETSS